MRPCRSRSVGGVVHDLAADDHCRGPSPIEVQGVGQFQSCGKLLELGERHAQAERRVSAVDGDEPDGLRPVRPDEGARVPFGREARPKIFDGPVLDRLTIAHEEPGAPNRVLGVRPEPGQRAVASRELRALTAPAA